MTEPHLDVSAVGDASHKSLITAELLLPQRSGRRALVCEIVRAVAHASTEGRTHVTDHALLDRATAACEPVVDEAPARVRELVADVVRELEALGDFAQLVNGNWVCTPPYIVDDGGASDSLLIAGLPVRALGPQIRGRVRVDGPVRRIEHGSLIDLPAVDLARWKRGPGQPIGDWMTGVLSSELGLPDRETVRTAHYRFYLPGDASTSASQDERWFPTNSAMNGRHLARVRSVTGTLDNQLVELEGGRVTAARSLGSDTARRLMYGLDLANANPTRAQLRRASGGSASNLVTVKISNPLPHAETRQLVAAAVRSRQKEWDLPLEYISGIPALDGLGIAVFTS